MKMKKYIGTILAAVFVLVLPILGSTAELRSNDTKIYPHISKADNHGKHTAPPAGKPDKRKWQGTTSKK